ncbi:hypothetical protein [Nocardia sp. CA-119907]
MALTVIASAAAVGEVAGERVDGPAATVTSKSIVVHRNRRAGG